jgi:uncharacterized membrane protein YccC
MTKALVKLNLLNSRMLNFFMGEYFTDALRNTLAILTPIVLFFWLGNEQAAIGTGVGALLISLTDLPGNRLHKFRTAVLSIAVFFVTALIFTHAINYPVYAAAAFLLVTFLLSMLVLFGNRAALTGTMAIILSTFLLGLHPADPWMFSFYILAGCCWFYLVSLLQILVWPFRSLKHAIFECMISTADFLRAKARCYDLNEPLDDCYQDAISRHIRVSEKQDLVRDLLLSDKQAMKSGDLKGKRLLEIAVGIIGLYEQVTAIHYDYRDIRHALDGTNALVVITRSINLLADELKSFSKAFLTHDKKYEHWRDNARFTLLFNELKTLAGSQEGEKFEILRRIIRNLEEIATAIKWIGDAEKTACRPTGQLQIIDYRAFLSTEPLKPTDLLKHFSFGSPVFRFSLRLAISFFIAYGLIRFFPAEKYSYWMLLTIVIVARPKFGVTWKRNKQRLIGTLAGLLLGLLLLFLMQSALSLLIMAALLLLGFFAFNRLNYTISVMCITPAVILCLSLYHGNTSYIVTERFYYTLAGCAIAFLGVYLFPVWEGGQLTALLFKAIEANQMYLEAVTTGHQDIKPDAYQSKLSRKHAHISLARLSETLNHVLLEPRRNTFDISGFRAAQLLCYRINAVITAMLLWQGKLNTKPQQELLMSLSADLDRELKQLNLV